MKPSVKRWSLFLLWLSLWCGTFVGLRWLAGQLFDRAAVLVPVSTPVSRDWQCLPAPTSFEPRDLVGSWVADFGGGTGVDTLVLREDGTYHHAYEHANSYSGAVGGRRRGQHGPGAAHGRGCGCSSA